MSEPTPIQLASSARLTPKAYADTIAVLKDTPKTSALYKLRLKVWEAWRLGDMTEQTAEAYLQFAPVGQAPDEFDLPPPFVEAVEYFHEADPWMCALMIRLYESAANEGKPQLASMTGPMALQQFIDKAVEAETLH